MARGKNRHAVLRTAAGTAAAPRRMTPTSRSNGWASRSVLALIVALMAFFPIAVLASEGMAEDQKGDEGVTSHDESLYTESSTDPDADEGSGHGGGHDDIHDAYAVLFPWFTEAVGVFVFLLLTRKVHALPYTAVMFLVGTFMGVGASRSLSAGNMDDQLTQSIYTWTFIEGEVVLSVFLPGLLFWDALDVNFFLFKVSFWQLLLMAFPMVLAGTTLTALVGYYIFPYGWSFMLSMAFGAILAATDPVAVAALLNEVGAPPRLKMHVSGESLLNDGSAVVFATIFSRSFLYELDIGIGQTFTVGEGFALFFRMSLGGALIGMAFGLGLLLLLFYLNRRLEKEENVLQVAATITVAYLSFYTAEVTCHTSGVISVVMCGITTRAFGSSLINDRHTLESFWILVEHLLNTLLFTLGGVVWGETISQQEPKFEGRDWGYLLLLYVFVQAIRFFLVFAFYPLLSRIGLKTNLREAVFLSFGGLRGAVGIALALAIDHAVTGNSNDMEDLTYSSKLFGFVGGIALLTLIINGTLAGPLLHKLGLAKSSDSRARVVGNVQATIRSYILDRFIHLLADPRFCDVEFAVVRHHVPPLENLTVEELKDALLQNKKDVPADVYERPHLKNVLPYLGVLDVFQSERSLMSAIGEEGEVADSNTSDEEVPERPRGIALARGMPFNFKLAQELRLTFLELVRAAYQTMVEKGELDSIETGGFVVYALQQSLDIAADKVSRGKSLCDWEASQVVSTGWTETVSSFIHRVFSLDSCRKKKGDKRSKTPKYVQMRNETILALAFISAHQKAQQRFLSDFNETSEDFQDAAKLVIEESEAQVEAAEELVKIFDEKDVKVIISHLFCVILLNKTARYVDSLTGSGLLKPREAHTYIEQIEEALHHIHDCSVHEHPGEFVRRDVLPGSRKFSVMMLSRLREKSVKVMATLDEPFHDEGKNK